MLNPTAFILSASAATGNHPGRYFRIKLKRAMIVPDGRGLNVHAEKDTVHELPETEAFVLRDEGDCEVIGEVRDGQIIPKTTRIDPTAHIKPVAETPANLKGLPSCFADVFKMVEERRVLLQKRQVYERASRDTNGARAFQLRLDEADQALRAFNGVKLGNKFVDCSNIVLREIEQVNELREKVESLALEAFSIRVAGLGLSETHTRRAFGGSALYHRFFRSTLTASSCSQARFNGRMIQYLDVSLEEMVSLFNLARSRFEELSDLLTEVQKEVTVARKFSPKAA